MIPIANSEELRRLEAQYSHLKFIQYCWQNSEEYAVGRHTRTICKLIDDAVEDFKHGKSTYLIVKVHPRAGKSEILSQNLTAHFIGAFPDKEVMICCYNSTLAEKNSRLARRLVNSEKYKELYPDIKIEGGVSQWNVAGYKAMVTASGLLSGVTGNGYSLGMVDDYISGPEDAESQTIRNKIWEEFSGSFFTRRAPVSITIILATQWHVDDIIGRIEDMMNPGSENYKANFPKFKIVSFPACNAEGDIWVEKRDGVKAHWERQKWDYLFPERFGPDYYEQQLAALGSYRFSALYQCNPQIRGGNLFDTGKIKFHDDVNDFPKTRFYRVWDYAHSAKQTQKADPDWTSGTLLAYTKIEGAWHLWIKDVARIRGKSPERDNFVRSVAEKDGSGVPIAVENSIDSKDSVNAMQTALLGRKTVIPIGIRIDKVARASYVEPVFESGHVHVLRGAWNLDWLTEVKEFPSGKHDDQVDNFTAGYQLICASRGHFATA